MTELGWKKLSIRMICGDNDMFEKFKDIFISHCDHLVNFIVDEKCKPKLKKGKRLEYKDKDCLSYLLTWMYKSDIKLKSLMERHFS